MIKATENSINQAVSKLTELSAAWNIYSMAYALDTDAKDPAEAKNRDGNNLKFFAWNIERWGETRSRLGIVKSQSRGLDLYSQHLMTLAARLLERGKI